MALQAVVDSLDAVDEAFRPLYVADGVKFKLDVEGLDDAASMRVELATVKREAAERRRAIKDLEERYAGIDPDKVKAIMSKLDQDGEQALIAAGKIDEVFAKRNEKLRADLQKQIDDATEKTKRYSQKVLDDRIKDAVIGKVHVHAIKSGDVMRAARELFTLDENGDAVQLGSDGKPILGKDGKTPFGPVEWIDSMIEIAPHWFPNGSAGGGAGGSSSGSGSGKTMTRAALEALPPRDRAAAVKQFTIKD